MRPAPCGENIDSAVNLSPCLFLLPCLRLALSLLCFSLLKSMCACMGGCLGTDYDHFSNNGNTEVDILQNCLLRVISPSVHFLCESSLCTQLDFWGARAAMRPTLCSTTRTLTPRPAALWPPPSATRARPASAPTACSSRHARSGHMLPGAELARVFVVPSYSCSMVMNSMVTGSVWLLSSMQRGGTAS